MQSLFNPIPSLLTTLQLISTFPIKPQFFPLPYTALHFTPFHFTFGRFSLHFTILQNSAQPNLLAVKWKVLIKFLYKQYLQLCSNMPIQISYNNLWSMWFFQAFFLFFKEHLFTPRGTPEFRGTRFGNRCVTVLPKRSSYVLRIWTRLFYQLDCKVSFRIQTDYHLGIQNNSHCL